MRLHLGFAAAACLLFTIPALASPIYIGVISFNELIPVAGSTRRIPVITAAVEDSSQESEALAALTGQGVSDSKAQSLLQLATAPDFDGDTGASQRGQPERRRAAGRGPGRLSAQPRME